jgi:hypothetical protein
MAFIVDGRDHRVTRNTARDRDLIRAVLGDGVAKKSLVSWL